ncbi:DUF4349 domain-containing protein [Sphaerisporangium album]|uniref:DUF4349 domain-containing protein n=1 Tax=Sphaerisporangium album TaxID=509200 RepID=A0A367FLM3_9ACTN|nr:DUF4349 domain-containing protein [Sphaerisporangium album]RCG30525.1 DUF4349 domain-containing protein [Sphaerisporangium album]
MSRLRCRSALLASLAGAIVLLAGCGGGGVVATSADNAGGGSQAARAPMPAEVKEYAGAAESASSGGVAPQASAGTAGTGAPVKIAEPVRSIVYTGDLTVRATNVTTAADKAKQIVGAAGGRLDNEESTSYGSEGGATLVFKLPPGQYQAVLGRLGKELGRREALRQATEDVTEQVADVDSRLKSARSSLDQLRSLLSKAKTIGEVLSVEREISAREADLESLQARQKTLAARTAEATLTLRLVGPAAVVQEPDDDPPGFLSGLKDGWNALVTTVKVALTVLGALLPWLVVLAVVWAAVAALRRRARRRRAAARPQDPGDTAPAAPGSEGADGDAVRIPADDKPAPEPPLPGK